MFLQKLIPQKHIKHVLGDQIKYSLIPIGMPLFSTFLVALIYQGINQSSNYPQIPLITQF